MNALVLTLASVLAVAAAGAVLQGHPAARHMIPRQRWRYWAHRAGILWSPSSGMLGVPFGSARQRAQLRAGLPVLRPSLRDRARIIASHTRRGLRAECPATCSEMHTERRPCARSPR